MPRQPSADDPAIPFKDAPYDFAQASRILEAMDFLRKQAVETHIPEIIEMIDASFRLMVTTHYCILRHRMQDLPEADGGGG